MKAEDIVKMTDISEVAKILLSAVAGALIQHLLDAGFEAEQVFNNGTFIIEKENTRDLL